MLDLNTRLNHLIVVPTAHSNPIVDGDDLGRTLSPIGIAKAQEQAFRYKSIKVELVLTSPAVRCMQTAEIVFPDRELTPVEELYVYAPLREAMLNLRDTLSAKKGNLSDYIEGDTAGQLLRWGWHATIGIYEKINANKWVSPASSISSIAIVGHAGFSDMIGAFLFPEHAQQLSNLVLHKAGVVVITPRVSLQHEY